MHTSKNSWNSRKLWISGMSGFQRCSSPNVTFKISIKREGERKSNPDLVLCPVSAGHYAWHFIHLLASVDTHKQQYEVGSDRRGNWGWKRVRITQAIAGNLEHGTWFQVHELSIVLHLLPAHAWCDSIKFNNHRWAPAKHQIWRQELSTVRWISMVLLSRAVSYTMREWHINPIVTLYEPRAWVCRGGAEPQDSRSPFKRHFGKL